MVAWQREGFLDSAVWKFLPEKISPEALPENLEELQALPPPEIPEPGPVVVKEAAITQHYTQNIQHNQIINVSPEAVQAPNLFLESASGSQTVPSGTFPAIMGTQTPSPGAAEPQVTLAADKPEEVTSAAATGKERRDEIVDSAAKALQGLSFFQLPQQRSSSHQATDPGPSHHGGARPKVKTTGGHTESGPVQPVASPAPKSQGEM